MNFSHAKPQSRKEIINSVSDFLGELGDLVVEKI